MGTYEELAGVYDQLMNRDVNYSQWADYLWDLICEVRSSPTEGLELAAGTGNLTEALIRKNCHIDAFDRSEEMLMAAREKNLSPRDVRFYRQDMLDFRFSKQYDFAVCACDSLNYLLEDGDLERVLKKVFDHLKPGGVFVFDMVTLYRMQEMYGNETFIVDQEDVYYVWKNLWDPKRNRIGYEITFFVRDDEVYERFDEIHIQRGYTEDTIRKALEDAGFEGIESYEAFGREPITDTSERMQWRAVRGV